MPGRPPTRRGSSGPGPSFCLPPTPTICPARDIPVAYLAESRLIGREVSSEALVADGRILWINQTDKQVISGSHPVERRHVVPAELCHQDGTDLASAMRLLVGAVGFFGTGVLHAEWILTGDGPSLVECAGRLPGDRIVELIDLAWGVDLCAVYTKLLTGVTVDVPFAPSRGAAVVLLGPAQGIDFSVGIGICFRRRVPCMRTWTCARERPRPAPVAARAQQCWSDGSPRSSWPPGPVPTRPWCAARAGAAQTHLTARSISSPSPTALGSPGSDRLAAIPFFVEAFPRLRCRGGGVELVRRRLCDRQVR